MLTRMMGAVVLLALAANTSGEETATGTRDAAHVAPCASTADFVTNRPAHIAPCTCFSLALALALALLALSCPPGALSRLRSRVQLASSSRQGLLDTDPALVEWQTQLQAATAATDRPGTAAAQAGERQGGPLQRERTSPYHTDSLAFLLCSSQSTLASCWLRRTPRCWR